MFVTNAVSQQMCLAASTEVDAEKSNPFHSFYIYDNITEGTCAHMGVHKLPTCHGNVNMCL